MFNDIGALELATLVILAVLVFGPDKLPKVIQDVSRFIRKVREFSDNAKEDIRSELGPEFKDFDFEDLNPKKFVRKQLAQQEDELGLKEIRGSFNLTKEMNEVADSVHGRGDSGGTDSGTGDSAPPSLTKSPSGTSDLLKKDLSPRQADRPPFDADAT
ncbi:sec-independent translocase [Streptomyces sp. NBC_01498]|uniref:sec-independent translocase n=1 Tax=Streptomyces sp. NBC_01498 TaxID=2975870 RepID=UPI002E7B5F93|nr:sec-independent translocase [Streptomyces sp. NBC_01498]WTL24783.1 sec-independent translocase [Streptomyces sp. NBC_01498]